MLRRIFMCLKLRNHKKNKQEEKIIKVFLLIGFGLSVISVIGHCVEDGGIQNLVKWGIFNFIGWSAFYVILLVLFPVMRIFINGTKGVYVILHKAWKAACSWKI